MIDWTGTYCGDAPSAATWAARWNGDPLLIALLAGAALAVTRLAPERRLAGFGAVAALAITFMSPLCALSVALFSARSVHHLLLIGVAAPLLAAALPARRALPIGAAFALSTGTLWAWHLPAAYNASLANKGIYWAMQASLLATAWLYWDAVRRAPVPLGLTFVGAGAAQMGLLGALLTFVTQPLYASHLSTTAAFGIGPVVDQQLAGLIMWVVGLLPYAVIGAALARGAWRRMATA